MANVNTTVAVAATSTQVRPAVTGRQYLMVTNTGAVEVCLAIGDAAVAGAGIILPAGASWEMGANETFAVVNAICAAGTSSVAVCEW